MGMGIPWIEINIHREKLTAALDYAANYNYVRDGLLTRGKKTEPQEVHLALRGQHCHLTTIFKTDISLGGLKNNTTFLEVVGLQEEVPLGHNWLIDNQAIMDYRWGCVRLGSSNQQTIFWTNHRELQEEDIHKTSLQTSVDPQHCD